MERFTCPKLPNKPKVDLDLLRFKSSSCSHGQAETFEKALALIPSRGSVDFALVFPPFGNFLHVVVVACNRRRTLGETGTTLTFGSQVPWLHLPPFSSLCALGQAFHQQAHLSPLLLLQQHLHVDLRHEFRAGRRFAKNFLERGHQR